MTTDQKRADHRVEFTIEPEQVTGQIICDAAPDADCRLCCPDDRGCEEYSIEHDADGPFHTVYVDGDEVRHPLVAGKHCGVKEWLEGDSVLVSYDGPAAPVVNGPIVVEWDGDSVTWQYPAVAP